MKIEGADRKERSTGDVYYSAPVTRGVLFQGQDRACPIDLSRAVSGLGMVVKPGDWLSDLNYPPVEGRGATIPVRLSEPSRHMKQPRTLLITWDIRDICKATGEALLWDTNT